MRECMKELEFLLNANTECIWVNTYEEMSFMTDLKELLNVRFNHKNPSVYEWSVYKGLFPTNLDILKQIPKSEKDAINKKLAGTANPTKLFSEIEAILEEEKTANNSKIPFVVFVFKDYHHLTENNAISRRGIRDIKEKPLQGVYAPFIVVSPLHTVPSELSKLFTVFHYDLPSKDEIVSMLDMIENTAKKKDFCFEIKEKDKIIKAALGLTLKEIQAAFKKAYKRNNAITVDDIEKEKIQAIKNSGLLNYSSPTITLDDIGGNAIFKNWVREMLTCYADEAKEFGIDPPKGYVGVGLPGTSKTMSAEAIAGEMQVPLLQINTAKIFSKLVGDSERNMDMVLNLVKATAPCVLLFDEIEKELGGVNSSNNSDGGTTSRVFAKVLDFLNKNDTVFAVFTSNDISQLPPELTRYGRLDARWYFGLPTFRERYEIFKIHFRKTGRTIPEGDLDSAARDTEGFTGAEIQEVVKNALRKAFNRYQEDHNREITYKNIKDSIKEIVPLSESSKERVAFLNRWSTTRARRASEEESPHSTKTNIIKVVS